jgi:hypothetical protein
VRIKNAINWGLIAGCPPLGKTRTQIQAARPEKPGDPGYLSSLVAAVTPDPGQSAPEALTPPPDWALLSSELCWTHAYHIEFGSLLGTGARGAARTW